MNTAGSVSFDVVEPAWKRLDRLLASRRDEILLRESSDDGLIHIYDCGDIVTFERSACLFQGLFPSADVTVLNLNGCDSPIVMLSVRPSAFRMWSRGQEIGGKGTDLTLTPPSPLSQEAYSRWHNDVVEGNI
ncbi:MAG: hypothetical protein ACI395_02740 [Candidatus Cryptobacteroides sp.]